jgi:hypothetical protein
LSANVSSKKLFYTSNSWFFLCPIQNIAVFCGTNMNFALKGSYITARDVGDPSPPPKWFGGGEGMLKCKAD